MEILHNRLSLQNPIIPRTAELYVRITDTIFSVLVSFSFVQYSTFIVRPDITSLRFSMLLFAYFVVTTSRVGYHLSAENPVGYYKYPVRFVIDLWILYGYFVLLYAPGPTQITPIAGLPGEPDLRLMVNGFFFVSIGYLAWDLEKMREWGLLRPWRLLVTIGLYLVSLGVLVGYFFAASISQSAIAGAASILIAVMYTGMAVFWSLKLLDRYLKRLLVSLLSVSR